VYLSRFNILCFSLDYSVFVLFAFVVLGLVFSVLCQEIGRDVNETFNLQHCAKTMNGKPASLDVTKSSVTQLQPVFTIIEFIHHISIKT